MVAKWKGEEERDNFDIKIEMFGVMSILMKTEKNHETEFNSITHYRPSSPTARQQTHL